MSAKDYAIFEVVNDPGSKFGASLRVTTPADVLQINSREDLEAKLKEYEHQPAGDPKDLLYYVEKVRPALRYYCEEQEVPVPIWLRDDVIYTSLTQADKEAIFGARDVNVREFVPIQKRQGEAGRAVG